MSFQRYRTFFAVPGVPEALLASVIGRLPIGVATLAILLFVQSSIGSFAFGGSVAALYVLGLAAIAPFVGRIIDGWGPRLVLGVSAIVYPATLLAMMALVAYSASFAWIAPAALLAGAALPPITICMRALYPQLLPEGNLLQTAYSVDSALVETVFILGPALVALFVAVGWPGGAVLSAAACASMGSVVFLRSGPVRAWKIQAQHTRRGLLGPLESLRLRAIFAATLLYSTAFGLIEVAITAFATERGSPAASGVILGLSSLGSASGVLFYGSRDWSLPIARQFLVAVGLMAAGILLLAPIANLYFFAVVSIIAAAPAATVIAVQSLLVSKLAPRSMLAESFTWGATCLLAGISAGIALGGALAEQVAPAIILFVAAIATLASGIVVWLALARQENRR
jgi:MFS family permease